MQKQDFSNIVAQIQKASNGLPAVTLQPIDLTKKPLNIPMSLLAGDVPLIAQGELATIVALPSSGKSNILEGIAASYIAANGVNVTDTLGFTYTNESVNKDKKILWIDTERTENDILWSVQRLANRCNNIDLSTYIDIYSFGGITDVNEATDILSSLCNSGQYDIVLIDGVLDLCPDINNIEKATAVVKHLRALAVKNNICIVTTIHPNKGTENIAGHLGAMLYRFCRAILYIKKVIGTTVRTLTNEAEQGKLSHSSENVNITFDWNAAAGMFLQCDTPQVANLPYNLAAVVEVFSGLKKMPTKAFKAAYGAKLGIGEAAVRPHCKALIEANIIKSEGTTNNAQYILIYEDEIPF